ncbi:PLDc N-terminal domain-containing protein [Psychroflexus montanilacus]|nr:PLDc N-terminal domain-containing protein [Psychroflexus montanilacus]
MLITFVISVIDITKTKLNRKEKLFWIIIVLAFNIFGIAYYFLTGKKKS